MINKIVEWKSQLYCPVLVLNIKYKELKEANEISTTAGIIHMKDK